MKINDTQTFNVIGDKKEQDSLKVGENKERDMNPRQVETK